MTEPTELELAVKAWKKHKGLEDLHKGNRLQVENDIARLKNLEFGSNTFHGIKVTVGNKEEWDTESMTDLMLSDFFTLSYKPNTKVIRACQQNTPDTWKELQKHQTLTPKKNAFTLIKEKE